MDAEQRLIDSIVQRPRDFADALDAFVGQLLAESGHGGRPTDGVVLAWEELGALGAFGFGVVVMIAGQCVEPLRVQFALDPTRSSIASGSVQFGERGSGPAAYGSGAHHAITRRILGDRGHEFDWKEQFVAGPDGWRRMPAIPTRSSAP